METTIRKIKKEQAWELRHQVMWPNKPFHYIKLTNDDLAYHFGLFKEDKLVSVVSLCVYGEEAQFRKFATLQQEQGNGYGSLLLNHVIREAKNFGVIRLWCNARENKVSFYQKFDLKQTEHRFNKGGKAYVVMERRL